MLASIGVPSGTVVADEEEESYYPPSDALMPIFQRTAGYRLNVEYRAFPGLTAAQVRSFYRARLEGWTRFDEVYYRRGSAVFSFKPEIDASGNLYGIYVIADADDHYFTVP